MSKYEGKQCPLQNFPPHTPPPAPRHKEQLAEGWHKEGSQLKIAVTKSIIRTVTLLGWCGCCQAWKGLLHGDNRRPSALGVCLLARVSTAALLTAEAGLTSVATSEQVWFIVLLQATMIKHSAACELWTAAVTVSAYLVDLFVFLNYPFLQLSPLLNK